MNKQHPSKKEIQKSYQAEALHNVGLFVNALHKMGQQMSPPDGELLALLEQPLTSIQGGAGFFNLNLVFEISKAMHLLITQIYQQILVVEPHLLDLLENSAQKLELLLQKNEKKYEKVANLCLMRLKESAVNIDKSSAVQEIAFNFNQPQKSAIKDERLNSIIPQFLKECGEQLSLVQDDLLHAPDEQVRNKEASRLMQTCMMIKGNSSFFQMVQITLIADLTASVIKKALDQQQLGQASIIGLISDAKYRLLDMCEAQTEDREIPFQDLQTRLESFISSFDHLESAETDHHVSPEATSAQQAAFSFPAGEQIASSGPSETTPAVSVESVTPNSKPNVAKQTAAKPTPKIDLNEIAREYLNEAKEHVETLESKIILLEGANAEKTRELVDNLFRAAHSVKGGAGFLGFKKISQVSHFMENTLEKYRAGTITPSPENISYLLLGVDLLRNLLQQAGNDDGINIEPYLRGKASNSAAESLSVPTSLPAVTASPLATQQISALIADTPHKTVESHAVEPTAAAKTDSQKNQQAGETIRVSTTLLNRLMALAGELVLIRNQQLQLMESSKNEEFSTITQRLNLVTTELQENIMRTRMQPIRGLFSKFPRIVRDLARQLGKKVDLVQEGQDVELDRTILESLSDPLIHLVRNAIDHGIGLPQERRDVGKNETGILTMRASHEEGMVLIQIIDDGKGIARERLKKKALEKNLFNAQQLETMSDRDIISLIFHPGFSTAEKITDVSGRGVGMDVVRENIEQLGGFVQLFSQEQKGTTIEIRLPLTLAIMPSLIIRNDGLRYAIPQTELVEVICLYDDEIYQKIEIIQDTEVYRLREELLLVVRLSDILKISTPLDNYQRRQIADRFRSEQTLYRSRLELDETIVKPETKFQKELVIVVLRVGIQQFGLVVDDVLDTEEIVVKPMHTRLKDCRCFSGATIMGDGKVALILDVARVLRHSGLHFQKINKEDKITFINEEEKENLLFFTVGDNELCAAPISMISRVEQVQLMKIETMGSREVIALHDTVYLIIRLERILHINPPLNTAEDAYLIVFKHATRPCGVLAKSLQDISVISKNNPLDNHPNKVMLGTFLYQNKVVRYLDMYTIPEIADMEWFQLKVQGSQEQRIMILSASTILQSVVHGYLRKDNFKVFSATDAEELNQYTENHIILYAILVDLETLDLRLLDCVQHLKGSNLYRHIPIIGICQHQEKINPDMEVECDLVIREFSNQALIDTLHNIMKSKKVA